MPDPRSRDISIRVATAADHILLAEIGAETFRDTFAVDNTPGDMAAYLAVAFGPDRQAAELADPTSRFLLAELDGETAGYARLRFGAAPGVVRGARPMEIARLYARRRWIGRGVGATLMQACLTEAEKAGCDCVWLDVWERNPRAIVFYEKWGFGIVGEQTFPLGSDLQRDWLMMRSIVTAPSDESGFGQ